MSLLRQCLAVAGRLVSLVTLSTTLGAALGACDQSVRIDDPPTITLTPASITAVPGDTVRVRVTTSGSGAQPVSAVLVSAPTNDVVRVDQGGLVTAVAPGSAVLTVTFNVNGQTVTGSIPVAVLGITLEPRQATIAEGGVVSLRATVVGDFQSYGGLRWSSSDSSVATVDQGGTVRGLRGGVARIAVTAASNPRVRAEAAITVMCTASFVGSLTVSPSSMTLQTGASQQINASGTLNARCGEPATPLRDFGYRSSDTTIATVSATGLVTARRGGTATVTVFPTIAPSITQAIPVTVRDPARGPAIGFASITTGDPPVSVDPSAVRGTIVVTANVQAELVATGPVRLELRLAGRTVGVVQLPAAPLGSIEFARATFTVNTAARDAAGAALYPNGAQTLELAAEWGCAGASGPCTPQTALVQQRLTLANP
jgi:uncharacterized protein YjdB